MPTFMKSKAKGKKYSVIYNNKTINFGDSSMQQYRDSTGLGLYTNKNHLDLARRKSYLARAKGIKNKNGEFTWKLKSSANYYSVRYLWG